MINYLALIVALTVSAVSAYYSIIGLTTLFAAAFWPVVIMGISLELGKLVTTSWLYRNWDTSPWLLKSYLSVAVAVLMFITSMGTFGFLSRAHIEQQLNITTGDADRIAVIDSQIQNEKSIVADYDKQIAQIDDALNKITEKGRGESSLQAADKQRKTRNELVAKKNSSIQKTSELNTERIRLSSAVKKTEAEVGPLKYIAEALYGTNDVGSSNLERAVRFVIILLVVVFDPLAVVLLIAANHGLSQTNKFTNIKEDDILIIDNNIGEHYVTTRPSDKEFNNRHDVDSGREQDLHQERRNPDTGTDDQRGAEWIGGWRDHAWSHNAGGAEQALQDRIRPADGQQLPKEV